MKKKIMFFLIAVLLTVLAACSSPEAKEVLNYHNDFVDYSNPKMDEVNQILDKIDLAETNQEAYDIGENVLVPIIKDVKDYLDEQDPKEDVTEEYHEILSKWANTFYKSAETQNDAYEEFIDGSEDKGNELADEAEDLMMDANDYDEQALEKWDDIMDEYDFEEKEDD